MAKTLSQDEIQAKKMEFVRLRCEGKTYRQIEELIGISKQSLVKWGKIYNEQIKEAQLMQVIDVLDDARFNMAERLQNTFKRLDEVDKAIETRVSVGMDSLKDLYTIRATLLEEIDTLRRRTYYEAKDLQDERGESVMIRGTDEI